MHMNIYTHLYILPKKGFELPGDELGLHIDCYNKSYNVASGY